MIRLVNGFMEKMNKDNLGAHAANAAFFIFLSIFPILILVSSILPYTPITEADMLRVVTYILPDQMKELVSGIIGEMYDKSVAVISISAVFVIWSAAKGMLAILRGLNAVQEVHETRNYIILRLWSCIYTIILLAVIIFSMLIIVFGNLIGKRILTVIPEIRYVMKLLMSFRYLLVPVFMAVLFDIMFTFMTNRRNNLFIKLPGAVFASVGWTVFSWGFSFYIDHFGSFNMYGSLTTIIIVMLWLYFCMYILLLGDEINSFLQPLFSLIYLNLRIKKKYRRAMKKHSEDQELRKHQAENSIIREIKKQQNLVTGEESSDMGDGAEQNK